MKGLFGQKATEHEQVTMLLSAYIDGHVNAPERAQVEKHLQSCVACRANLATLSATVQAVQALPAMRLPRSFTLPRSMARHPRPSWAFPIFRAATAVAAMLLILVIVGDLGGLASRPAPVAAPQAQPVWVAMDQPTDEAEGMRLTYDGTPQTTTIENVMPPEPGYAVAATTPAEAAMGGGAGASGPNLATPLAADMAMPTPDDGDTAAKAGEAAVTTTVVMSAHPVVASAPGTNTLTPPTTLLQPGSTQEAAKALPTAAMQPLPAPLADTSTMPTVEVQIEPTAVAAVWATPTQPGKFVHVAPTASVIAQRETDLSQATTEGVPNIFLRALEFGLAGLTILLGVSTLFTSGRVRWR